MRVHRRSAAKQRKDKARRAIALLTWTDAYLVPLQSFPHSNRSIFLKKTLWRMCMGLLDDQLSVANAMDPLKSTTAGQFPRHLFSDMFRTTWRLHLFVDSHGQTGAREAV